jgi:hypothetical protein
MRRITRLMLVVFIVIILMGGCSTADPIADPIELGTPKNDVIDRYGPPDEWLTITIKGNQHEYGVVSYFSSEALKQGMPLNEIWVFVYNFRHGGESVSLFIEKGVVEKIVVGE